VCEEERAANGGKLHIGSLGKSSPALRKRMNKAHQVMNKLEKDNEKEDEAMMIRLIKVRQGLWT